MPEYCYAPQSVSDTKTCDHVVSVPGRKELMQRAAMLNASPRCVSLAASAHALQRRTNPHGLPSPLKENVETLSKCNLDEVNVHYNSSRPGQFGALATTQDKVIDIGPGQERHLPHESWHVVQQMKGQVPVTGHVNGTPLNDSPHLEADAERMGAVAMQMRPMSAKPLASLHSGLMGSSSIKPVQMFGWGDVFNKATLKAVLTGGAVGAGLALTGVGGLLAGLLGGASFLTSRFAGVGAGIGTAGVGLAAALAGGALPGVAGTIAKPVLGTLGGVIGTLVGADVHSALRRERPIAHGNELMSIGELVHTRASFLAESEHPSDVINAFDDPNLWQYVSRRISGRPRGKSEEDYIKELINEFYENRIAAPKHNHGDAVSEIDRDKDTISQVLEQNAYIKRIFDGTIFRNKPYAEEAIPGLTGNVTPVARTAREKFNHMVRRDRPLPPVNVVKINAPHAAMSPDGDLYLGWGAPPDTVVHEFGHHLENYLFPSEFGTLHNFLRARSQSGSYREIGFGTRGNEFITGAGYDTPTPNPVGGSVLPLTKLVFDGIRWKLTGSVGGERGIDNFVQHQSHIPEMSYETMVYDFENNPGPTEFLSTTFHLMANGETARKLVQADPLRVCLFLYLANRPVYREVHRELYRHRIYLNQRIHRLA